MKDLTGYSTAAMVWALRRYGEAGPRTFRSLLTRYGRLDEIFLAEVDELKRIDGLGEKRSRLISEADKYLDESEDFIKSLDSGNIKYSTLYDENYPVLFQELNDPPPIIFYLGRLPKNDEKTVAIVGSHKATNEGISYAVELAKTLAEKSVSIVSGMAVGIDTAGHIGALKGNGPTYALLGSGLDSVQKENNRALAGEILKEGGIISEYPPDAGYSVGGLMARNRLIVGLSQAVVIGEVMADSSGTLDSATFCNELGKIMFILIDGCERPGRDNSAVEKILAMGGIPFNLSGGIEMIIKALV